MKNNYLFLFLCLFTIFSFSCNPECELLTDLRVVPEFSQPGHQVIIKANPLSALRSNDISVYFDNKKALNPAFVENIGLIITVPNDVSQNAKIRIADPDCESVVNFNAMDSEFYINNPTFIPPAPPNIYFPITPPVFPPSISNAWVSPQNLDYCIWFKMLCVNGNETSIIDLNPVAGLGLTSSELSVDQLLCGGPEVFYHGNPVTGILDPVNNIVHFWIDRTSKNLGVEEFEGQFINIEDTHFKESKIPFCGDGWIGEKKHMMLATSKETGRQLLLYQQLNPGFPEACAQ